MLKIIGHIILYYCFLGTNAVYYKTQSGSVEFTSIAPLEKINAVSKELKGIIDITENNFTFTVPMNSFAGFNNDLQREHFKENYIESTLFPTASFKGKIIESINFNVKGRYSTRAKGEFNIHGVSNNIVIPCIVEVIDDKHVRVNSNFKLDLDKFNITIPKIVNQKISNGVDIFVKCSMVKQIP